MKVKVFQKGFNFSQDGPGNRLVYHLQGCNLRCLWCANPEGIAAEGCLLQKAPPKAEVCPFSAIINDNVHREKCVSCIERPCTQIPGSGLEWSCIERDIQELMEEIRSCSALFFDGGGVTFTGGEATLQFDALYALLQACRAEGVHTALESNALSLRIPEILPLVDYCILDCKHYDSVKHKQGTGQGNAAVIKNICHANETREQLLLRIALIGGYNAAPQDARGFAQMLNDLDYHGEIELLRYHEYGKQKWAQCGLNYTVQSNAAVSIQEQCTFAAILRESGLRVIST